MVDELDFFFPFIVFFYGIVMITVTSLPIFHKLAHEKMSADMVERFYGHRLLGWVCGFVGALWLLQRAFIA